MKTTKTLSLSLLLAAGAVCAQTAAPAAATPEWTVVGNASLNSDYRFRGFTQTNYGAAFQGGVDIAHSSGFYVGNWNSNVAQDLLNGGSLEMDFYGGHKGELAPGLGYDVGAIYFYYPQSGTDRSNIKFGNKTFANKKVNNHELYFGLSYGPLTAKLYYITSDYFKAAELADASYSTRGTIYLDLGYSQEIAGLIWGAHYGLLSVKHHDQAALTMTTGEALPKSVGDYKLSLGKDIGSGYVLTGSYVGTTQKAFFGTDLGAGTPGGKSSLILSMAKTF